MEVRLVCSGCGTVGIGFKWCAKCRLVKYCSKECQTSDWPHHKPYCLRANPDSAVQKNMAVKRLAANTQFVRYAEALCFNNEFLCCEVKLEINDKSSYVCCFQASTAEDRKAQEHGKVDHSQLTIKQMIDERVYFSFLRFSPEGCRSAFDIFNSKGFDWALKIPVDVVVSRATITISDGTKAVTISSPIGSS